MGGSGSGTWYRLSKKDLVEDSRKVDVRQWHRDGFFGDTPRWFVCTWSRDGRPIASIDVEADRRGAKFSYSYPRIGPEGGKESVGYTVPLEWTGCNFGGERPWFVCPGVVNGRACYRKVAKLYLKHGLFLCRHCQDLTYETRNVGGKNRDIRKCQAIRERLGGSGDMTRPFPPRPKGMHRTTYERLRREHDAADERYTRTLLADLEAMNLLLSRLGGGKRR